MCHKVLAGEQNVGMEVWALSPHILLHQNFLNFWRVWYHIKMKCFLILSPTQ